ncbi:branched-chain amino acid transport system ATP-binding protein [Rhodoligotrophos appendicifer]|uniref:ABC transporter ATP-binding protein n=1 Tax=Rhodoligotrophos appendicifer TaxID=987056 RepID=UPI0011865B86|nr:ABC transporter ATP-binding protein [Rhodoligotrophos appendicifer]
MPATSDIVLRTEGLTKEFSGFVAVSDVSLSVRRGTVHALIGPNGAGKTTVFNLLTGFLPPTSGQIFYKGEDVTRDRPAAIARRGMVRSFQISAVFPHLSVRENIGIALQRATGTSFFFWRHEKSLNYLNARIESLAAQFRLLDALDIPTVELPYGRKRALEIATTLALEPDLLLLDEPMAGLGRDDIDRVSGFIRDLANERTVLMVEHNLSVVARISDVITVLTHGQVLAEGPYAEISRNPKVLEAYVGTAHAMPAQEERT